MIRLIGMLFLLSVVVLGGYKLVNEYSYPNTFLGGVNISLNSEKQVEKIIDRLENADYPVRIGGTIERKTMIEWGYRLNREKVRAEVFDKKDLKQWMAAWKDYHQITPELIPESLEAKIENIADGKLDYDSSLAKFICRGGGANEEVDESDFRLKLMANIGNGENLIEPKTVIVKTDCQLAADENNRRLSSMVLSPLTIKTITYGKPTEIPVKPTDLESMIKVDLAAGKINLGIKEDILYNYLLNSGGKKATLGLKTASENLRNEVNSRFNSLNANTEILGVEDGPNTDGKVAGRYLEIDLTQQKMYLFDSGNIFKTYKVSTGLNYPTPVGRYKIMSKAVNAYSDIFKVWMPYWMAFNYATDIQAYLGIHELPYKVGSGGDKVYRFGDYIGTRKTGGCIALEPGEAKEVYDFTPVGTTVVVVE